MAIERNGSYDFYHADGLGSIVKITDENKQVVQSYIYDLFGTAKPQTDFRNSYAYTGREWDKETGLYYYRARYYDPMEGRFISKDPISFAGGDVNLYGYVKSNPTNFVDPTGLFDHAPGGPWHPDGDPVLSCKGGGQDSCAEIKMKIYVLKIMLFSHIAWDLIVEIPRGTKGHLTETKNLLPTLAKCERLKEEVCKDCDDKSGPPKPPSPLLPLLPLIPLAPLLAL